MPHASVSLSVRRTINRRRFLRGAVWLSAGSAAYYALGCSSDSDSRAIPTDSPASPSDVVSSSEVTPMLLTGEFVAGQNNRFAVGLLDDQNNLVRNASVNGRFFKIGADGSTGTLRGEGALTYNELNIPELHEHDRSGSPDAGEEFVGFYVANVPFDDAGKWGAEITASPESGTAAKIQAPFEVLAQSKSPGIGTVPPASNNETTPPAPADESLCSRDPLCPFHDKVIADQLGGGRPLVVQFSTPAFCETRFCGPVLEALIQEAPAYQDRIDFVHVEVWKDFQAQQYREAVTEWNLPGEPYTFFIGGTGKVVGRLEAIFSEEELRSALDQLVAL